MRSVRAFLSRIPIKYVEATAVAAILLVALLARTVNLSTLPAGFHGDEAVVGLEAQRILDEGHIGVYSPRAAGQPTGPMYPVALSVWLFGNTIFAVRIVPALFGTLTVLALYAVLRRNLGAPVALIGAGILAVMNWHIHFARVGFPIAAWPLVAVLMAGATIEAIRSGRLRWWALAGALTGSGIYVYNAHPLLAATLFLFLAGYPVAHRGTVIFRRISGLAVFVLAMIAVLIPMIRFATAEDTYYWEHFDEARITNSDEWRELQGWGEQARFLLASYRDAWEMLSRKPRLDLVDGTGLTVIIPTIMLGLAGLGMLLGLWRTRHPLVYLGVMVILIMPLGPALSIGGEVRRALVIAPFLAAFCALACVEAVNLARRYGRPATLAVSTAAALVVGIVAHQNLTLYFDEFADPEIQARIMGKPITDAAEFLNEHGNGSYVYFYSSTWSIDYVTMQYLAPDVAGEDRSERFGEFHFRIDPVDRKPIFVFLGSYLDEIEDVRRLYPGREITPPETSGEPTFRAYQPLLDRGHGIPPWLR